ncbi:MAG: GyrI-like domain-containing protein [Deltaproteobacteria bacterium]|nr:GyrI-like domain-containing protein [Deltaproteobacteria bacterium]
MGRNIFKPTIKTIAPKCLFGNWMILGGPSLDQDYELVWEALSARVRPVAGLVRDRFGLGVEVRLGRPFRYWTAVELSPGAPVPAGMSQIIIHSGLYLVLDKDPEVSLDELYDFIYNFWEDSRNELVVSRSRLCLEQYGPVGRQSKKVTLYAPLANPAAQAKGTPSTPAEADEAASIASFRY